MLFYTVRTWGKDLFPHGPQKFEDSCKSKNIYKEADHLGKFVPHCFFLLKNMLDLTYQCVE